MSEDVILQLIRLVWDNYGNQAQDSQTLREHFLKVFKEERYFLQMEDSEITGYLEWRWVPGIEGVIHITELITTKPGVIWTLKKRLYDMPWSRIMFCRHKTGRWRHHRRMLAYV
jgi:hypothetical protein